MAEKMVTLNDLLVDALKDLYSAESQVMQALPKMAKAATSPDLKQGFEQHLEQTRMQRDRIERIFSNHLQGTPKGKKCAGMEGLITEGNEIMTENMEPAVRDAALIAAAQKVEHYEIASYGTVATYADMLGMKEVGQLIKETLNEEETTDKNLTKMAKTHINREARK